MSVVSAAPRAAAADLPDALAGQRTGARLWAINREGLASSMLLFSLLAPPLSSSRAAGALAPRYAARP